MTDIREDDEDPATIRAAFDRGPHGFTSGSIDAHKDCRAALDAAQDEIERLRAENRSLIKSLDDKRDRDTNPDTRDYLLAISGEGPQAQNWADKPHRLIYDLINKVTAITRQRDAARELVVRSGYFQNDTDALSGVTTRTDR